MKAIKVKTLVTIGTIIAAKQLGEIKGAYIMLRKIDKKGYESSEVQELIRAAKNIEEAWKKLKKIVTEKKSKTAETPQEEETVIDVTETTAEEAVDQPED